MASQYNLTIEAGTDFEAVIYIGLGDSTYTFGTNKDYRATLKPSYGGTPQYSFDIKEKQADNKLTLSMREELTRQLTSGIWHWDLIELQTKTINALANAFTTTNADATVEVNWSNHGLTSDDKLIISGSQGLPGGFSNGAFDGTKNITIVDDNNLTFEASGNANATATGGAATLSSAYKTIRLLEGDVLVTPYVTIKTNSSASTEE
tara:strand:+ start:43183 stop:43800 length:618 start_codon:yes stop_codon:yes gene_type:complete